MAKGVWSDEAENTLNSIDTGVNIVVDETRRMANFMQLLLDLANRYLPTIEKRTPLPPLVEQPKLTDDTTSAVLCDIIDVIHKIKRLKAADTSNTDIGRNYAVTITMLEQAAAYFSIYVYEKP